MLWMVLDSKCKERDRVGYEEALKGVRQIKLWGSINCERG